MKKRLISLLLTLSMVFSMVPMLVINTGAASVGTITTEADLYYAVKTGELEEKYNLYLAWYHSMFMPDGKDESLHEYCESLLYNQFANIYVEEKLRTGFLEIWASSTGKTRIEVEEDLYAALLLNLVTGKANSSGEDSFDLIKTADDVAKTGKDFGASFLKAFTDAIATDNANDQVALTKKLLDEDFMSRPETRKKILEKMAESKHLAKAAEAWKKVGGFFDVLGKITSNVSTVEDIFKKLNMVSNIVADDANMVNVLQEIRDTTEDDRIRSAATELLIYLTSSDFTVRLTAFVDSIIDGVSDYVEGKVADLFWDGMKKYNPGVQLGMQIADALFDVTGEAESIYTMMALQKMEDALFDATYNLKNDFKYLQTIDSASTFVAAMEMCYRFAITTNEYTEEHLEVIFKSGIFKEILKDQEAYNIYKESLNESKVNLQNSYKQFYDIPRELYEEIKRDLGSSFTITYNANGGSNAPASQTKLFDESVNISADEPEREGYEFAGWAKKSTAKTYDYLPGDEYKANEDVTLYAVWHWINTEIIPTTTTYTVTYYENAPQGTVTNMPAAQTKEHDKTVNISSKNPSRDGYEFEGWSTSSIADKPDQSYEAGNEYSANSNLSLYAVWKKNAVEGTGIAGDINKDGIVDNSDLIRFREYLDGKDVDVDEKALNVDGIGEVNEADHSRLHQYLTNWDVEIFYDAEAEESVAFTVTHPVQGDILSMNLVKIVNGNGYMTWTVNSSHDWTVDSSADWCTFSIESGSAGKTDLRVNFKGETTDKRDVIITFTVNGETRTVTVRQQKADFSIEHDTLGNILAQNSVEIENIRGFVMEWTVSSDFDWIVSGTSGDWFTVSPTSGKANKDTTLKITAKDTIAEGKNEGDISFYVNGDSYVVVIYQENIVSNTPDAPTNLKAVNGLENTVTLTWDEVPDADGYYVYRKIKGQTFWESTPYDVSDTEYVDTSCNDGTTYVYMVRAYKEVGAKFYFSEDSNLVEIRVYELDFKETASLFWEAGSSCYIKVTASDDFTATLESSAEEWLEFTADQAYSDITIEAKTSNYSNKPRTAEITVTCGNAIGTITVTQAACGEDAPTLRVINGAGTLTILNNSDIGSVTANTLSIQTCTSNVRRVYIEVVSVNGSGGTNKTELLNGGEDVYTTYNIPLTGLNDGKYKVTVFASNSDIANSKWAQHANNVVFYFTKGTAVVEPVTPSAPTNLKATTIDHDSIKLTWNAVDGAEGYIISRQAVNDSSMKQVKDTTSTSWTDNNCEPDTKYYYVVVAYIGSNYSNASKMVSATTDSVAEDSLEINPTTVSWGFGGGNEASIYYTASGEIEVDTDVSWINYDIHDTYVFLQPIAANSSSASRTGIVTITCGSVSKTVTVVQAGNPNATLGTPTVTLKLGNSVLTNGYTHVDSYTGGDVCYIEAKFTNTDHFYRSFEGDVSQNRVWDNGTFKNGEYVAVWVNIPKDIASGTYKIEVKASNSSTNNDDNAETATAYMFIKVKNDSYDKLPALTGNAITDLVAIATSQIGYTETASDITKYGEWYGLQDDWCAMFISWCANKANIDTNVIPKTAGAGTFRSVGTQHKVWGADFDSEADDVEYIPKKGDIVLLMPYNESTKKYYNAYTPTSHVGIVSQDAYKDSNGDIIINTIEGNYSDSVKRRTYKLNDTFSSGAFKIQMIVTPKYK